MIITFERRFAMAHRLIADPTSKCATPHGHNEIVTVDLFSPEPLETGRSNMAAPFERLKARWHGWIDSQVDHAFQLSAADPMIDWFRAQEPARLAKIMTFDGDPTTEAAAIAFHRKLTAFLAIDAPSFQCLALRLQETPTNSVTVNPDDAAAWSPAPWCDRADDSINDLG